MTKEKYEELEKRYFANITEQEYYACSYIDFFLKTREKIMLAYFTKNITEKIKNDILNLVFLSNEYAINNEEDAIEFFREDIFKKFLRFINVRDSFKISLDIKDNQIIIENKVLSENI